MKRLLSRFFRMFHSPDDNLYTYWLVFVLFCGSLPMLVRLLLASALNEMPEKEPVDYFVLSDFIFFGILLNAAAVVNSASEKSAPSVFNKILCVALVSSLFLTLTYAVDITIGLSQNFYAWIGTLSLTSLAIVLSYYTTDHEEIKKLQETLDRDDTVASLAEPMYSDIKALMRRISKDETIDVDAELEKLQEKHGSFNQQHIRRGYEVTIENLIQRETTRREQRQLFTKQEKENKEELQ